MSEPCKQCDFLRGRIEQLHDTCKYLGVEMHRDGYGRNVAADEMWDRAIEAAAKVVEKAFRDEGTPPPELPWTEAVDRVAARIRALLRTSGGGR